MDKIYYQPNHLWKGQKAVKKLKELSGEKPKTVKQWLYRQAFWQVHLPAPKRVDRPHYQVTIPNETHQFDLLYMPSDTLYGNKYKYILAGIDATSTFKVARPLRTKQARDIAEMILDIYKVGPLTYPSTFQCDNGSEFKGEVTKMLEKNEVKIQRVTTKYKHTHTAFVEALNKILAERLFKVQDAQKLNDPERVSATSYGVYISQLIRYARCCSHYDDFRYRHKCLVDRLLSQGYKALRSLSRNFMADIRISLRNIGGQLMQW